MFKFIADKKNIIIIALIFIFLAGGLFWVWRAGYFNPPAPPEDIILFYSKNCSHCANVEDFIKSNKVEEKIKFTQLEVSTNQTNAQLLGEKAIFCKVDISMGAPVPFLWDGEKCLVGDADIIKFFQDAIK